MTPADTALTDQLLAATRDAQRVQDRLADRVGSQVTAGPARGFLGQLLADLSGRSALGLLDVCPHLGSPVPTFIAAWLPGQVFCAECAAGRLLLTGDDDRRCDRCQCIFPTIRPGSAQSGPLVIFYGVCEPCWSIVQHEQGIPVRKGKHR